MSVGSVVHLLGGQSISVAADAASACKVIAAARQRGDSIVGLALSDDHAGPTAYVDPAAVAAIEDRSGQAA